MDWLTGVKRLTAAAVRGDVAPARLAAEFDRALAEDPGRAETLRRLVEAAASAGLPDDAAGELRAIVAGAQQRQSTEEAHVRTVRLPRPDPGADDEAVRTVKLRRPPAPPDPVPSDPASPDPGPPAGAVTAREDAALRTVKPARPPSGAAAATARGSGDADGAERTPAGDRAPAPDPDATAAMPSTRAPRRAATRTRESETTVPGSPTESDVTVFAPPEGDAGAGGAGTHGASEVPRARASRSPEGAFRPGDTLRDRFELVERLGEGPLGPVWKARDLLKARARDRRPYVSVKVLHGDFRARPESLVALQREIVRTQRLAHPNIAGVRDFDRDDATGTVFMTTEFLEGRSLLHVVRELPAGGLPDAEAMALVEQIAAGLAYAHERGVVHSDLCPQTCFVTHEGTLKLLDLGIRHAAQTARVGSGSEGPAAGDDERAGATVRSLHYATPEVLAGAEPSPADDVFALAAIAYELLAGRHPWAGLGEGDAPAPASGLAPDTRPAPVPGIGRRRNRGLARALSLRAEQRTSSVESFLEEVRPRTRRAAVWAGGAIAAGVLVAALGWQPALDAIAAHEREAIVQIMRGGGAAEVAQGLDRIAALESERQRRATLDDARVRDATASLFTRREPEAIRIGLALLRSADPAFATEVRARPAVREAVVEHFAARARAHFDPEAGKHDYVAARALLDELDAIYPDSASVLALRSGFERRRDELLARLERRFETLLAANAVRPRADGADTGDVLAMVAQVAPGHRLLDDPRLEAAIRARAEEAIARDDFATARSLLDAGIDQVTSDAGLRAVRAEVEAEIARREDARRAAATLARVEQARTGLDSLDAFAKMREDLLALARLLPGHALVDRLRTRHAALFRDAFEERTAADRDGRAAELLAEHAALLPTPLVLEARTSLDQAGAPLPEAPRARRNARVQEVNALLAEPALDARWDARLRAAFNEYVALSGVDDDGVALVRHSVPLLYRDRALEAAARERFAQATALLARGRAYASGPAPLAEVGSRIEEMRTEAAARRAEAARLARIRELEVRIAEAASAGDPAPTRDGLAELRAAYADAAEGPDEDARAVLARAHLEAARALEDAGEASGALAVLDAGLEAVPGDERLVESRAAIAARLEGERLAARLRERFAGEAPLDVARVRAELARLEREAPAMHARLETDLVEQRARVVRALAARDRLDGAALAGRLAEIRALFPARAQALAGEVADRLATRAQEAADRDPLAAHAIVEAGLRALPEDERLRAVRSSLPAPALLEARRALAEGRLRAARAALAASPPEIASGPEADEVRAAIERRAREATARFEDLVDRVTAGRLARESDRRAALDAVLALWSDNPEFTRVDWVGYRRGTCHPALAGEGADRGGTCWDLLAENARGPLLVVVPSGRDVARPFAIGRYEVSVAQWNAYCATTGRCTPRSGEGTELPVTGVTRAEADAYAEWLSARASAESGEEVRYRLPTDTEWTLAALADGRLPRAINCRPAPGTRLSAGLMRLQGGKLALGTPTGRSLVSTTFGEANAWGLVNHLGNAQEWATSGAGLVARGGAYPDPAAECAIDTRRPHDGGADEVTSFRLVRELG